MIKCYPLHSNPLDKILSINADTVLIMRIHVSYQGKKTTISVDDKLIEYLGAYLVQHTEKYHSNAKFQAFLALDKIRNFVSEEGEIGGLPSKNLSQYVQSRVINWIIDPVIVDILSVRGPLPKKRVRSRSNEQSTASEEEKEAAFQSLKKALGK